MKGRHKEEMAKWENRLYQGDNLEILTELLSDPQVRGQVRLIYIDPPYGTGQKFTVSEGRHSTISRSANGSVAYDDRLTGEDYLAFLKPRLVLLREILSENGSLYIHIDCKIGHYVKVLMDDVFGIRNFRNDITRIKCNPKNFYRKGYSNMKDMLLFYSKSDQMVWNHPKEKFLAEDLERLFPKTDENGKRYTTTPLHAPGETQNGPTGKPWKGMRPPKGRHWRCDPETLTSLDKAGLIEWSSTGNPRLIKYAEEAEKRGKFMQDVWVFKDPQYPVYPTEKNLEMLKMIVQASSLPDDLIMDCFCGSGVTLLAAQQLGRRWIGIDRSELGIKICEERLFSQKPLNLGWRN